MIKNFPYKSRGLAALPHTYETADRATEVGIKETELESSMRSVEWLHENGKCLDNLRPNASTIPQAGRGAFATRFIPKGNVVAPAPLIHIPFKETLLMYGVLDGEDTEIRNSSDVIGKQLLLNYCFGHASSTILLCPYGSGTAYINHNHQQPNAKIAWPDEKHSLIHKAEWLNKSINFLEDQFTTGLEFDFVATKDIHPGEEVFIDYGSEWEVAWNKHVNDWAPTKSAPKFEDASKWNCFDEDCNDAAPLRTEVEQRVVPYAKNLEILCFFNYDDERILVWKEYDDWRKNNHSVKKFPCNILQRYHAEDGSFLYTVKLELPFTKEEEDNEGDLKYEMEEKFVIVKDLPQFAIQFINSQYKSDLFLRNAFRHELMIPDNMMPSSWKNLNPENGS